MTGLGSLKQGQLLGIQLKDDAAAKEPYARAVGPFARAMPGHSVRIHMYIHAQG